MAVMQPVAVQSAREIQGIAGAFDRQYPPERVIFCFVFYHGTSAGANKERYLLRHDGVGL